VREAKAEATRTTVDPEPGEGTRPPCHARHSPPSSHCPRRFLPPTTFVTANSCAEFLARLGIRAPSTAWCKMQRHMTAFAALAIIGAGWRHYADAVRPQGIATWGLTCAPAGHRAVWAHFSHRDLPNERRCGSLRALRGGSIGWVGATKSAREHAFVPSASDACSTSIPHALSSRSPVPFPLAFSLGPARYPSSQTQSKTPSKRTMPISFTPRWIWCAGTPRSECRAPILEPAAVGGVSTGAGRAARSRCPAGRRAERGVRDAGQSTQVRCLLLTPNGPDDDV
jgi:hypothetical protein